MNYGLRRCFAGLLMSVWLLGGCAAFRSAVDEDPVYHVGTTRKMFQMTGDFDRPLRRPTRSLTETRAGVAATDLLSSFEHKGLLYFLFGDCWGREVIDYDTFATTTATIPDDLILHVPVAEDGKFHILSVPGIKELGMAVASGGISVNGRIYIVHTAQWNRQTYNMERSVMARSDDDGFTWTALYDLSRVVDGRDADARFLNISMEELRVRDYPRGTFPWRRGNVVLIWGSGKYRASNVCLAAVPSDQIDDRSAIRYFSGLDGKGRPEWSAQETDAAHLFDQPQVGEFSVRWVDPVKRWVMLYNASEPRGITMRTARLPWGPWSEGSVVMDPWVDGFYGVMAHVPWGDEPVRHDGFHDPYRHNQWGGEYGPYLVSRFTEGNSEACRIYYTLSTWNPYQVVLMRSTIGAPRPEEAFDEETVEIVPGDEDWLRTAADFYRMDRVDGVAHLTTLGEEEEASTGCMWRWLPRDARNRRLQFSVRGGGAEVMVLMGSDEIPVEGVSAADLYPRIKSGEFGEVIFCTWGHDTNDIPVRVDWPLTAFDSENLKVVIIDHLDGPWGFVSVSEMHLVRTAHYESVYP